MDWTKLHAEVALEDKLHVATIFYMADLPIGSQVVLDQNSNPTRQGKSAIVYQHRFDLKDLKAKQAEVLYSSRDDAGRDQWFKVFIDCMGKTEVFTFEDSLGRKIGKQEIAKAHDMDISTSKMARKPYHHWDTAHITRASRSRTPANEFFNGFDQHSSKIDPNSARQLATPSPEPWEMHGALRPASPAAARRGS